MKVFNKKPIDTIAVILGFLLLAIGILYMVYKTWTIFGFWNMIWTGLITSASGVFIQLFFSARSEKNEEVIFNPKEAPRFLHLALCLGVAYYLYSIISGPSINKEDYVFGLLYLILLTLIPMSLSIYRLIRDSKDFVAIDSAKLRYRDNNTRMEFATDNINHIELGEDKVIKLHLNDGSSHDIPLANMNFTAKDALLLYTELKKRFPDAAQEVHVEES